MKEKKHKRKGRLFALLGSLLLAAILFVALLKTQERMLNDYEKVSVLVAVKDISANKEISKKNYREYFEKVEIQNERLQEGSYQTLDALNEYEYIFTTQDIQKNEQITSSKITKSNDILANYKEPAEVSFKVEGFEDAVGGTLRRGDIINVTVIDKVSGKEISVLENAFVSKSLDNQGNVIAQDDATKSAVGFNVLIEKADVSEFNENIVLGTIKVTKVSGIN